jgi:putative membrane protein
MRLITADDLRTAGCGVLMGSADIVPGVSGGTVALVLGIYNRLVTAISHFDRTAIGHVLERRWSDAAAYVDLRFLVALFCGIGSGIVGLAFLMHYLLMNQLQFTFAVFSGLILGSGVLVARSVQQRNLPAIVAFVAGIAVAWGVVGLDALQNPPDSLWYLFLCGAVGICAMILPGISGAFILLILGQYDYVTGLVRGVLKGDLSLDTLTAVAVFCCGCLTGLLTTSRGLRWLLSRHQDLTLAMLCGFMIGSLRRIWPFKLDLTPDETKFKLKRFVNVFPESLDGTTLLTIVLAAGALIALLSLEALSRGRRKSADSAAADEQRLSA